MFFQMYSLNTAFEHHPSLDSLNPKAIEYNYFILLAALISTFQNWLFISDFPGYSGLVLK